MLTTSSVYKSIRIANKVIYQNSVQQQCAANLDIAVSLLYFVFNHSILKTEGTSECFVNIYKLPKRALKSCVLLHYSQLFYLNNRLKRCRL